MESLPTYLEQNTGLLWAVAIIVTGFLCWFVTRHYFHRRLSEQKEDHRMALEDAQKQLIAVEAQLRHVSDGYANFEQLLSQKESKLDSLQQQNSQQMADLASARMELSQQKQMAEEKLQLLTQAKDQLKIEFETLAQKIFDEKSERFNTRSRETLSATLDPLKQQLTDFRKRVDDVYDKENRERASLKQELHHLKELNQQISQDALNLTNALKGDKKTQGNWGEVILERVLEESGLRKGREYETQVSLVSDDGRRRAPDVVVRLPENKDIIIDAKVSLVDYERFCNSSDEEARSIALKAHTTALKNHIAGLSFKDYESLQGIRSLDFVFIFIPIEAAFMAAFEADQTVFRDAYEKNIIVVSPTTLLATLKTVQSIWRYERQNKNAEEIARQAGAMHDKFVGFISDLENIATHIDRAAKAQADAMNKLSSGNGNLVGRTLKLEKLGAKAKKALPASLQEEASGENENLLEHDQEAEEN